MEKQAFFWRIVAGELPAHKAAETLGIVFKEINAEAGTIEVELQGKPEFTNPAGNIQGGFLAAMLDDTTVLFCRKKQPIDEANRHGRYFSKCQAVELLNFGQNVAPQVPGLSPGRGAAASARGQRAAQRVVTGQRGVTRVSTWSSLALLH